MNNAKTLRSLEPGWIYLLHTHDDGPSECWTSIIKYLQSKSDLTHVLLNGHLDDSHFERWTSHSLDDCPLEEGAETYHGQGSLRSRIERFILHGGDCPLLNDLQSMERTVDGEYGDHSWHFLNHP